MGSSQSKGSEPLIFDKNTRRHYNLPDAREKVRFEPEQNISYTTTYEASIDKFDYLIVFPLTEHRGPHKAPIVGAADAVKQKNADNLKEASGFFHRNRISWAQIKSIWAQVAFGTDEDKERAVEELSRFWTRRTGSTPADGDYILLKAWLTVAREAILDKLTSVSGLQCKLTASHRYIFCRVRAPIKLLELQADLKAYRLQFKSEIDPGSDEFWNRELLRRNDESGQTEYIAVELEEEKKLYSKEDALKILESLYRTGKISANELGLKDETQVQWSLRIHALERVVDRVPVSNNYPAYASFTLKPEKRHLFNTYSTVRGKTIFRSKDRIFLTKSIMDKHFDIEKLVQEGIVCAVMALHDANRGEHITKDILRHRWVSLFKASASEVGAPYVSHPSYEPQNPCPLLLRPFAQPLENIREYFGEKIALYFAWLGYYTCALSILFLFSMWFFIVETQRGKQDLADERDWWAYAYFLVLIIWSELYQKSWHRENAAIKVKWGTVNLKLEEQVRPQFKGVGPLVRSVINNNKVAVFPSETRMLRSLISYSVIVVLMLLNLILIGSVFYAEHFLIQKYNAFQNNGYVTWATCFVHALILQINAMLFPKVVSELNSWENYRAESDYEKALITKTLVFQIVNNFAAATFITFGKGAVFDDCTNKSCIGDLRVLLVAVIVVRLIATILRLLKAVGYSFLDNFFAQMHVGASVPAGFGFGRSSLIDDEDIEIEGPADSEKGKLLTALDDSEDNEFQEETRLSPYEGTFNSYSESALQFGFVSLFSVAMPLLAVYALLENFFLIRVHAWRLCVLHRRPHVEVVGDIGGWDRYLHVLSYMGVIWGCGIIVYAGPNFKSTRSEGKLILFLSSVIVLCLFKMLVSVSVAGIPDWVHVLDMRNQYILKKYMVGLREEDSNVNSLDKLKGVIDDNVDVDALDLYDLRKGKPVTEEEYQAMEKLENKRRVILKEIQICKERLQVVYKTEIFNENTGVGETKHGLPLGRLSVRLIRIEGLQGEGLEELDARVNNRQGSTLSSLHGRAEAQMIRVKISIRSSRSAAKGAQATPDLGDLALSEPNELKEGLVQLDQLMGPFAPVRTIEADTIFHVLHVNQENAVVASAAIGLRDLQDQVPHDMIIPLKVKSPNGTLISAGRLFVNMHFQYSRVLPVRRRIYEEQGKLREIERELALLKAGKSGQA